METLSSLEKHFRSLIKQLSHYYDQEMMEVVSDEVAALHRWIMNRQIEACVDRQSKERERTAHD